MSKKKNPYLLLIPQILVTVFFLIGVIIGITQSLGVIPTFGLTKPTLQYYKEVLTRPDMRSSVRYSVQIAFSSALIATVAGVFLCALLVMHGKTRGGMMRIVQLPIVVPHVVAALFIINIFSRNGLLARIAYAFGLIADQQEFPMLIYDAKGIGIVLAYIWKEIPFIIYFVIALMANINGRLGEAAVNLGAGRWKAFFTVTLPLCKNTILSGFLILFVFVLGAYEMPFLLGATTPRALPVLAYIQYTHPDLRHRPYAMALNGIIIVISLLSAWVYFMLMKRTMKTLMEKK